MAPVTCFCAKVILNITDYYSVTTPKIGNLITSFSSIEFYCWFSKGDTKLFKRYCGILLEYIIPETDALNNSYINVRFGLLYITVLCGYQFTICCMHSNVSRWGLLTLNVLENNRSFLLGFSNGMRQCVNISREFNFQFLRNNYFFCILYSFFPLHINWNFILCSSSFFLLYINQYVVKTNNF